MEFLVNRKWTGKTVFYLQEFLNQNHASYTMLQCHSENVKLQLPDMRQKVEWILDHVDCEHSYFQTEIYSIRMDGAPGGLRNNIEQIWPSYCQVTWFHKK